MESSMLRLWHSSGIRNSHQQNGHHTTIVWSVMVRWVGEYLTMVHQNYLSVLSANQSKILTEFNQRCQQSCLSKIANYENQI